MSGHCRDCRWWRSDKDESDARDGWKSDRGLCRSIVAVPDDEAESPPVLAMMDPDDPFCVPQLWTKPDFGCVQFEAKERGGAFSVPVEARIFLRDGTMLDVQQVVADGFILREDRDIPAGTPVILVVNIEGRPVSIRRLIVGEPQAGPVVVAKPETPD